MFFFFFTSNNYYIFVTFNENHSGLCLWIMLFIEAPFHLPSTIILLQMVSSSFIFLPPCRPQFLPFHSQWLHHLYFILLLPLPLPSTLFLDATPPSSTSAIPFPIPEISITPVLLLILPMFASFLTGRPSSIAPPADSPTAVSSSTSLVSSQFLTQLCYNVLFPDNTQNSS